MKPIAVTRGNRHHRVAMSLIKLSLRKVALSAARRREMAACSRVVDVVVRRKCGGGVRMASSREITNRGFHRGKSSPLARYSIYSGEVISGAAFDFGYAKQPLCP